MSFRYDFPEQGPNPNHEISQAVRDALAPNSISSRATELLSSSANSSPEQSAEALTGHWGDIVSATHERLTDVFGTYCPVPRLDEFVQSSVDFQKLKDGYEMYETMGMDPELLMAPVDLRVHEWINIYSELLSWQRQEIVQRVKAQLRSSDNCSGLAVLEEVRSNWGSLTDQAVDEMPGTKTPSIGGNIWKSLVVPTSTGRKVAYDLRTAGTSLAALAAVDSHMPLGAYLTLQAQRLRNNQLPVDVDGSSWIYGTFENNSLKQVALAGTWSDFNGFVSIGPRDIKQVIGVHEPIWG